MSAADVLGGARRPRFAAATGAAERLGASRRGELVTDEQGSFQVMADPEGNEFCFVHA